MLRSIGSTWVTTLARIGLVFLLTPFVIRTLGPDAYGVWLTIAAITTYLTEIRGGLPAASVKYLAEAVGATERGEHEGRADALNRVVHSALWLYLLLAFASAAVGLGLFFGWQTFGRAVPEGLVTSARVAFLLMLLNVAFGFLAHLPAAVMEAHGDFVQRNLVTLGSIALQAVLTVTLLSIDADVIYLAVTLIACASLEIVTAVALVVRRYDGVTFGVARRDMALVRSLIHYSAWVLVLAVGARLAFNTDAIVISTFDAYESVAHYSIANSIALYFMEFVAAIAVVMMPRVAQLRAAGDEDALRRTFLGASKGSMSLALLVGTFLLFMGPEFIGFWIDATFQEAAGPALQVLILSFVFFLPMRGAGVPLLMAVGDIKVPSIAYGLMGLVNIGVSIALVPTYGILGAAIGTAGPNILFAAIVFRLACREADVPAARYLAYAVGKPLVGALPVVAWLVLCTQVLGARGFFGLLYSGVGTVVIFAVSWLGFVYRNDPNGDLLSHPRVAALLRRLRPGA